MFGATFEHLVVIDDKSAYYGSGEHESIDARWFVQYINYIEEGFHQRWYNKGNKHSEWYQKNGDMTGTLRNWRENGLIRHKTEYQNGEKHGWALSWGSNGFQTLKKYYERGEDI